ncbi:MAG: class I SAM-dependent methyltransferase [Terracidiphilus sp.]
MAGHVCPWWLGYWMASPIRRWIAEDPEELLAPYLRAAMTVLEPGPAMGFFTLPMARLVGPSGRIIAVDIQPQMLRGLERRAQRAGLADRIETRLAKPESMGIEHLAGAVDFVLAFAVVHEMPSMERFFSEAAAALKPGAVLFLAEPSGHVNLQKFQSELNTARRVGLEVTDEPKVHRSHATALRKT